MSTKEFVGTDRGSIVNYQNEIDHEPQDSPSDGWSVSLHSVSKKIQKQYHVYDKESKWVQDTTIQIQLISW